MNHLVGLQCSVVVSRSSVTAGYHQLPFGFLGLHQGSSLKVANSFFTHLGKSHICFNKKSLKNKGTFKYNVTQEGDGALIAVAKT